MRGMVEVETKPRTVVLDTESTGLGDNAQIVEIAVVDEGGSPLFHSYCRPSIPVEPDAQAVHGISADLLATAPTWPEIVGHVRAVLEGSIVVIFNSAFDIRLLIQTTEAFADSFDKQAYDETVAGFRSVNTECAMSHAAYVYGPTNRHGTISLKNAVAAAGIEFQGKAHSAVGDAATTAALWRAMGPRLAGPS